MEAFGIFEGGGAKGIAHIGALKAAEERRVKFLGVAGTSAGAIVAALVAAGYTADEMYSPGPSPRGLFAIDFLQFLDRTRWLKFAALKRNAARSFADFSGNILDCLSALCFFVGNHRVLADLCRHRGCFETETFRQWIESALVNKLITAGTRPPYSGPDGAVGFADLPIPLKIIVADISNRRVKAYSTDRTPQSSVSLAIAASISIPVIFRPQAVDDSYLVDGGIVSNFPAWVFDNERKSAPPLTPSFGFKLASMRDGNTADSLVGFSKALFETAVFGDTSLETREVESLHEIPLTTRVGPLDFAMSAQLKDDVYRDGKESARDFFQTYVAPEGAEKVKGYLRTAHLMMQKEMNHDGHLRANVMRPVGNDRLMVVYSYNMDDDCDDRLEFPIGTGACSVCWNDRRIVVCDLEDAAATFNSLWKMSKYQQRLVRSTLKSLLCIPIFDQRTLTEDGRLTDNSRLVGVLNFDSDDRIIENFSQPTVQSMATQCARLMFDVLKN